MKSFASLIKLLIIIFVINHYIKKTKKHNKKVVKKQDTVTKNVMDIKEQTLNEIKTSDFLQFMADKINKQQETTNINEIERMPKIEDEPKQPIIKNNKPIINNTTASTTTNTAASTTASTAVSTAASITASTAASTNIQSKNIIYPLLNNTELDEINRSFNNEKEINKDTAEISSEANNMIASNTNTDNHFSSDLKQEITNTDNYFKVENNTIDMTTKAPQINKLVPDKWVYKNENPMNGGNFGGILGYDHMDSIYEAL